jgi:tRNA dimethylallyltransferase
MNTVIILLGPTGVGKTAASLLLAERLGTEIISADSMQIYRHMDIGTAKPSADERSRVKHHMIDAVEPWELYSTGKYIAAVVPIIERLHRKGKVPIIVGGTGLYIKAMTRGIFNGPSADWSLRESLLSRESENPGALYEYLREVDPEAAKKITPKDTRRTIRSLEVSLKSTVKMSDMQKQFTKPLPYRFVKIGLLRDRKELYALIEKRVDAMVEQGLEEEVRCVSDLVEKVQAALLPSMQAIGYKEIMMHLRGEISLADAVALIKRGSKRYAKRQFTWFRKEEGIAWIDITGKYEDSEIFDHVRATLKKEYKIEVS